MGGFSGTIAYGEFKNGKVDENGKIEKMIHNFSYIILT